MKSISSILTAGAICCLGAWPLPCSSQVNAEQVVAIGRNVLSMEDYMLAIRYFNQAIKAKPYLAEPYFYRALAKLNLDDYKGAEQDCSLALERNKFKTEAYKLRGFARQQMGLDSLAISDYDTGLQANPYDRYFLFYKGVAQTSQSKYEAADSTFSRLLKSHPEFDEGVAAMGRLCLLQGDTTAALGYADRAIRLNRTLLQPWIMKSQVHADRCDWAQALADMDEAIRIRPEEPDFYLNRAYLRYNADNFSGAMADYNYALQLDQDYVPALFNRALLRLEVKDLEKAAGDFTSVLRLQPRNFHALYNRGLAYVELGNPAKALADFREISRQYPRFYPVYYAIAECYRMQGNLRLTAENIKKADSMVNSYVANPHRNPLDRPAIAQGTSRTGNGRAGDPDGETSPEVMEQFDRLVTVSTDEAPEMAFNDRIKGRVQDRNVPVEPQAPFTFSLLAPAENLSAGTDTFRELSELNSSGWMQETVYLGNNFQAPDDQTFSMLQETASADADGEQRPVDWFRKGVAMSALKDYQGAVAAFTQALAGSPGFLLALMGRASAKAALGAATASLDLQLQAIRDFEEALRSAPRNPYIWFDKAAVHYAQRDYSEALKCLDRAVEADPRFGPAWYNRGLCLLQAGNKQEAFASLSRAGELGVLPSYNLLKRMK